MDFTNPAYVYRELFINLARKTITNTEKAAKECEQYLKSSINEKRPIIIVLDEVDQLLLGNKSILYRYSETYYRNLLMKCF